jgi:tRNA threonylcarbamoyladenosine biosynthesis protein TsaE
MAAASLTFQARSLDDTDRFGAALASVLPNGTTVCLSGTLGAGKTRLVRAIAAACGIDPENVVSPTFVLCSHYSGSRQFNHLDAYRINDDDEFLELGVDEMFASDGITFVEWGERVRDCLPRDRIDILIEVLGETGREFQVTFVGDIPAGLLDAMQNAMGE